MSSGNNEKSKSGVGEGVIQHKCPGCGAPLKYSPNAGSVICEYCGTKFEVSQLKTGDESKINFDWSRYKKSLSGEELEGTLTYECKQCGAVMEAPKNTIATFCPYCANNIVLKETSTGGLKPNLVIPFKFPKDKVHSYFKSFTRGKKLLPLNYFKSCMIGEVQGVYLPFWLFTTKVGGRYTFTSSSVEKSWSDSSYHYTKYIVYSHVREGTLDFAKARWMQAKRWKMTLWIPLSHTIIQNWSNSTTFIWTDSLPNVLIVLLIPNSTVPNTAFHKALRNYLQDLQLSGNMTRLTQRARTSASSTRRWNMPCCPCISLRAGTTTWTITMP